VIPESSRGFLRDSTYLQRVRDIITRTRVAISVAPLKGWKVKQ
jgi:hypothetical protein